MLGGTPQIVAHDVDSAFAFSPDGSHMAYFRANDPETGKFRLLSSKLDGSDEKVLFIHNLDFLPRWIAWSPDGKTLAYPDAVPEAFGMIGLFDLRSGKIHAISLADKFVQALQWSTSGDGLFVTYLQKGPNLAHVQIGFFSLSDGQIHPISRDTNSSSTITLSGDGKALATVQEKAVSSLSILPGDGNSAVATSVLVEGETIGNFNWSPDGSLLTSDLRRLLRTDIHGKEPTVLLSDSAAAILGFSSCGTRYFVFPWAFHGGSNGIGIWRVDADGSNPRQLTNGSNDGWESKPVCAGNWVYFFRDVQHIWRAPLDGATDGSFKAEPVAATAINQGFHTGRGMGISPDGKTLAYMIELVDPATQTGTQKIALLDLQSLGPPRMVDPNPLIAAGPQFTPDGKFVAYPVRDAGIDNLWTQPINGSASHQITKFDSEQMRSFDWSPDGMRLGVLRGHTDSDVVLFQESKP